MASQTSYRRYTQFAFFCAFASALKRAIRFVRNIFWLYDEPVPLAFEFGAIERAGIGKACSNNEESRMKQMIRAVTVARCSALSLYSFGAIAQDAAAPPPSMAADLMSLIFPLLVVIATGIAALWFVKRRYAGTSGNDALRIRSVLAVGPRERIVLVETERQVLVVGVCATSMSTLAQWSTERRESDTQL